MLIPVDDVRATATDALLSAGVSPENTEILIRSLVEAELRGFPSHGLLRLPRVIERIRNGVADGHATGQHVWTASAQLSVDGERGIGPVVAHHALAAISQRAKTTGIAVASIANNNHIGMLALYAEDIARAGQVLIGFTTSEALVHPWGGRTAMVGTNPVTIGVPASPDPFVMDMATGLVSMGKIHDYAHRGEVIPEGWALDAAGNPTHDAVAAKSGAIAPFGGAKGYALGLAFEVLVASLTATATGRDVVGTLDSTEVCNKGDVFIVVEPTNSTTAISNYLAEIRGTDPTNPAHPVLVPGDRALRVRRCGRELGIEVAPEVWGRIIELLSPIKSERRRG
ncbi:MULTISPECIES: Ldh family oxidoreductase [unclassified Cryobacterium]|uniref:Ldh family oxidoreductase n=1 Tax=unclassified Cryobacterium TaxID=2649013 RepID=UPI00106B1F5B|nr:MULTISPECIES: Ldh family oxidoreductase [unclassified Cryobacterium]TFD07589.1 Ldh family oxidoreductase [Cryobacterium sp. TMT1-66-1]TFD14468.1 Ldh family oxidoreductase [Cryobacterium sp. TMT1-2-2]